MGAIDEQQPLSGVEDDDGWEGVEHLCIPLHPRSVEVRLGIVGCVSKEVSDSQLRHRAHRRRQPDDLQPRLVALSQNQKRAGALSSSLTVSGDLWAKRLLSHLRRVECYPNGGYWINEGGRVRPSGGRHVDA